jgi:hypothetical protein
MTTRHEGDILEEEVLDDLKKIDPKSKLTNNSGAVSGNGDIHTSEFCLDTKRKSKAKNHIATADELKACKKQYLRSGRFSGILLENSKEVKVVVLPYETFLEIVSRIEDLKENVAYLALHKDD